MLITKDKISRAFSRISETNPCPKHGVRSQSFCLTCDSVICSSCGNKCGCADSSPSQARELLQKFIGHARLGIIPPFEILRDATELLRLPEIEQPRWSALKARWEYEHVIDVKEMEWLLERAR